MALVKIREVLDGCYENEKVTIRGWVYRKRGGKGLNFLVVRESKGLLFLLVRDSPGFIQCTVKKGSPAWNEAERLTIESSLTLEGTAKPDKRAPGGYEIATDAISIIGFAGDVPLSKDK